MAKAKGKNKGKKGKQKKVLKKKSEINGLTNR
jgi:hypothetical protein